MGSQNKTASASTSASINQLGYLPSQAKRLQEIQAKKGQSIALQCLPGLGKSSTLSAVMSELKRASKDGNAR